MEPFNLEDLTGEAKKVYRLIKDDNLSIADLDRAHEIGFAGAEFDDTNDQHLQMAGAVGASKLRLRERETLEIEAEIARTRAIAAEALRKDYGVDPDTVPDSMLDSIYASLVAQASDSPDSDHVEHLLSQDNDELVLVGPNDEIIAFVDAPHADLDRRNILEWVGERLTKAQAKKAGKQAEKDFWINKINKVYDPLINKQARIEDRLHYLYDNVGQAYLDDIQASVEKLNEANPQNKPVEIPKSVKVGLLTLAYKKDSAKIEIPDEEKAQAFLGRIIANPKILKAYLKTVLKDPKEIQRHMDSILTNMETLSGIIKVESKVMKSQIPTAIKIILLEDKKSETGIYYYPGGVPKYSMK